jgi:imidazolonepropionase-like amidohydrolase
LRARLLKEAGVKLAVGSDEYDTSVAEVAHLRSLGVFNDAEILRMWTAHCAGAFSGRRSGRLADGYEASFLAFTADPLADFEATRRIAFRVKDGGILELGPPPPEPSDAED